MGSAIETLDPLASGAALFADFVGTLAHHLNFVRYCPLFFAVVFGCGEDANKTYAGLSVATASAPDGLSYRVRFLSPPWEKSKRDPLVNGTDLDVELRGEPDQLFIPGTALVLEIDRESIIVDTGLSFSKYRLEAVLLECDLPIAAGESCAEQIAVAENQARTAKGEPSFYEGSVKTRSNDFDQTYYDLITKNMESRRYKRIAFFETPDPERYLRVYLEANPRLDEAEIDRMLNAIEVFEGEPPVADAGVAP